MCIVPNIASKLKTTDNWHSTGQVVYQVTVLNFHFGLLWSHAIIIYKDDNLNGCAILTKGYHTT